MNFESKLKESDFFEISTGGGCRAYRRDLENDWYIILTNDGGLDLPESFDEKITVGHYHDELNPEGNFYPIKIYKSCEEILEMLRLS